MVHQTQQQADQLLLTAGVGFFKQMLQMGLNGVFPQMQLGGRGL